MKKTEKYIRELNDVVFNRGFINYEDFRQKVFKGEVNQYDFDGVMEDILNRVEKVVVFEEGFAEI